MTAENLSALEDYSDLVVGKTLTDLFFTKQDGPHDYMPGIPPAYYFRTIIELDGKIKLRFGHDHLVEWNDDEPIIQLTNLNWDLPETLEYKGHRIVRLTRDDHQQLTIHLENGTRITRTSDYGDQLFIENDRIPDEVTEASSGTTGPNNSFPAPRRTWWQKLFGTGQ